MDITLGVGGAPMDVSGTYRRAVAQYNGPASYVTGGDPVDPNEVRMGKLYAIGNNVARTPGGVTYYLYLNGAPGASQTIIWIVATTGLQVANAVDLSTAVGAVEFIGQ